MTYLRNLFDLFLSSWLLRNLRREVKGKKCNCCDQIHWMEKCQGAHAHLSGCVYRKLDTIRALEAHVAELERMLK